MAVMVSLSNHGGKAFAQSFDRLRMTPCLEKLKNNSFACNLDKKRVVIAYKYTIIIIN